MYIQLESNNNNTLPEQKMKNLRNKKSLLEQKKSFTSSSNAIDHFTKSESLFLQKFFRYNLSDYFSQTFSSLEDGNARLSQTSKEQRMLQSLTFTTKTEVNIPQFSSVINEFYQSPNQQGQVSFKYLYSNSSTENLQKDEKVLVWVKMRCEVQTIENLPIQVYQELERLTNERTTNLSEQEENVVKNIKNSPTNVINLFIVYFGDINFHLFDKKNYGIKQVELFGGVSSVRIYVFYISRLSLINKFQKINKINENVCLNDLLIQLYEAKRQRIKNKRRKHVLNRMRLIMNVLKWSTVVSVGGLALALAFLKFTA